MRPLALALLLAASTASAQVYKWVDADGVTHYTNLPPPAGAKEVGDRMNLYQPDAPLDDAVGAARVERRKKPPAEKPAATPPPPAAGDDSESGAASASGPRVVQRPGPTWHSGTNIGYPSANNPGTRAAPPR